MAQSIYGVEVFAVGTWNHQKFVQDDLEEIARNTTALMNAGTLKPPLKLGHDAQVIEGQMDGDPAMGWVQNLRVQGDKLICDFVDVPDVIVRAIQAKLYAQVSVEMRYIENTGWLLTAVAILGADAPAVKTLNDLEAYLSEKAKISGNPAHGSGTVCFSNTEPKITFTKGKPMETTEATALAQKNAELERELNEFKAREKESKFSAAKGSFLAEFKADVQAGKLAPAILAKIETHLDSQKATFSDAKDLTLTPALVREITAGYRDPLPQGQHAAPGQPAPEVTADEALSQAIFKCQETTGLGYIQARDRVLKTNPGLIKSYRDFTATISQGRAA